MADTSSPAGRASIAAAGPIGGFLERFRRSAGVPAAAAGEGTAELAPVLAALDELDREVAGLRSRSEAEAARRTRAADEEAQRILAAARERADLARDEALRAGLRAADTDAALLVSGAEAEAETIRTLGEERLPELVAGVLERVLEAAP